MNRAQRRLQAKQNKKYELTQQQYDFNERVRNHYQKQINNLVDNYNKQLEEMEADINKEREDNIENDWYWFYSMLCLTLKEDYHKNNDYIANFITKVETRLRAFKDSDITRDELIKVCQEKCDIILCDEKDA